MKKKLIMAAVALLLAILPVAGERKYYVDWRNGYKGWANAGYLGTEEAIGLNYLVSESFFSDLKKACKKNGLVVKRRIEEISNAEKFLVWKALDEYDFMVGEVYVIKVWPSGGSEVLVICVGIHGNDEIFPFSVITCKWKW